MFRPLCQTLLCAALLLPHPLRAEQYAMPMSQATPVTTAPVTDNIASLTNTVLAYPSQTKAILSYYMQIDTNKIDFTKFNKIVARRNYQEIYDQLSLLSTNREALNNGSFTDLPYYNTNPPQAETIPQLPPAKAPHYSTVQQYAVMGAVAAGAVAVVAASGSGGGSGGNAGGGANNDNAVVQDYFNRRTLDYLTTPESFVDTEMRAYPLGAMELENAQYAWAKGLTGSGVKIGFFDWFSNDLSFETVELGPRVVYRDLNIAADCANQPGAACDHGIIVMGYAATGRTGSGTVGPAYQASLMMNSVFAGPLTNLADNGANVINLSCSGCASVSDLQYITDRNILVTIATGNSNQSEPSLPAAYASQFDYKVLAVTGVINDNGTITTDIYNRCGTQKEFCLAAYSDSGTSFAAPQVAGAAALLKQGWSFLTAKQIGQILLYSAKDLGTPGVDAVFGHGLLDMKAATEPLGTITVASGSGQINQFIPSSISQNGNTAFGDAFATAKNTEGRAVVVDSFGRDFEIKTADNLRVAEKPTVTPESLGTFGRAAPELQTIRFSNDFAMRFSNRQTVDGKKDMVSFAEYDVNPATHMKLGFSTSLANLQQNKNVKFNKANFISPALYENSFQNLSENNQVFYQEMAMDNAANVTTTFSTLYSRNGYVSEFEMTPNQFTSDYTSSMVDTAIAAGKNLNLNIKNGVTHEFNSMLGTQTSGAFDMANGANTYFTGLDTSYDILPDLNIFASYTRGITRTNASSHSSFTDVTDIISDSFSVTATKSEIAGHDKLSFSVGQPTRVRSGSANGLTQTVDRETGALGMGRFRQDLTPSGRTMLFQAAYAKSLSDDIDVNLALQYASQPEHRSDRAGEASTLVKMVYKFN